MYFYLFMNIYILTLYMQCESDQNSSLQSHEPASAAFFRGNAKNWEKHRIRTCSDGSCMAGLQYGSGQEGTYTCAASCMQSQRELSCSLPATILNDGFWKINFEGLNCIVNVQNENRINGMLETPSGYLMCCINCLHACNIPICMWLPLLMQPH